MNFTKVCLSVLLMAVACYSAALPDSSDESLSRQKRTLGIITTGANIAANGLSTAGKVAAGAIAVASAVKPLIMLGVGKYFLYNWLTKQNQPNAGNGIGFDASFGFNGVPQAPVWVEENNNQASY